MEWGEQTVCVCVCVRERENTGGRQLEQRRGKIENAQGVGVSVAVMHRPVLPVAAVGDKHTQ